MVKKAEQNKLITGSNGLQVEHNAVYDDSLLPPAEELERLKKVDPSSIDWIKKRTEIEQNARIEFNKKRVKLAFRDINLAGASTIIGLVLAFVLAAGFFWLSYDLILKGYQVVGGIFGIGDIAGIILALSRFQVRKNPPDK